MNLTIVPQNQKSLTIQFLKPFILGHLAVFVGGGRHMDVEPTCPHHLPHPSPFSPHLLEGVPGRDGPGAWSPLASTSFSPVPGQGVGGGVAPTRRTGGTRGASPACRDAVSGLSCGILPLLPCHALPSHAIRPCPLHSPHSPPPFFYLLPQARGDPNRAEPPSDLLATSCHQTQIPLSRPSSTLPATSPTCFR